MAGIFISIRLVFAFDEHIQKLAVLECVCVCKRGGRKRRTISHTHTYCYGKTIVDTDNGLLLSNEKYQQLAVYYMYRSTLVRILLRQRRFLYKRPLNHIKITGPSFSESKAQRISNSLWQENLFGYADAI